MRTRLLPAAMCVLALGIAPLAAAQDAVTMRASSSFGAYDASLIIRLSSESETMPLSEEAIHALLQSTAIGEAALQQALGSNYPALREQVSFGYAELGRAIEGNQGRRAEHQLGQVWLEGLDGDVVTAMKAVEGMVTRLDQALVRTSQLDHVRLTERVAMTRAELQQTEAALVEIRALDAELRQRAGRSSLFQTDITNQLTEWQDQARDLALESEHNRVEREVVAAQIAEVAARVESMVVEDGILDELRKIVDLRERDLARVREAVKNGTASDQETISAMEGIAAARTELLARQEQLRRAAGQGQLDNLDQTLQKLTLRASTSEVRLAQIRALLEDAEKRQLIDIAATFEHEVRLRQDLLADRLKQLHREMMQLEDRLRSFQPPRLTVIRGTSADSAPGQ